MPIYECNVLCHDIPTSVSQRILERHQARKRLDQHHRYRGGKRGGREERFKKRMRRWAGKRAMTMREVMSSSIRAMMYLLCIRILMISQCSFTHILLDTQHSTTSFVPPANNSSRDLLANLSRLHHPSPVCVPILRLVILTIPSPIWTRICIPATCHIAQFAAFTVASAAEVVALLAAFEHVVREEVSISVSDDGASTFLFLLPPLLRLSLTLAFARTLRFPFLWTSRILARFRSCQHILEP